VSKEKALQYLKLRGIEKQAAQVYEFVGGHMVHLKHMADKITASKELTFQGM